MEREARQAKGGGGRKAGEHKAEAERTTREPDGGAKPTAPKELPEGSEEQKTREAEGGQKRTTPNDLPEEGQARKTRETEVGGERMARDPEQSAAQMAGDRRTRIGTFCQRNRLSVHRVVPQPVPLPLQWATSRARHATVNLHKPAKATQPPALVARARGRVVPARKSLTRRGTDTPAPNTCTKRSQSIIN